jgi:protein TonB
LAEQRIGAALARGDVELAGELMRAADRAGVAPQRLAPLREQLGRLDGAQRAERLSRLVSARIREGQLLSPAGDSAKHHLEQLLKLPNGQRLGAAASDQLARALADRAQHAATQGQGAEAQQLLAEARALGYVPERPAAPPVVQPAPLPAVSAAATPPRTTEAAVARPDTVAASSARLSTPEPASRASSAGAAPGTTPAPASFSATDFKRTRYVAPVYPAQALSRGQSGEVRVRLTVDGSGRVSDVQVLSAAPAGVFDQAATNAVRKWRFEPIVRNGRSVEASVTTTISFRPDDAS